MPMQTGRQYTMQDVNNNSGEIAFVIRNSLLRAEEFKAFLERTPDAELVALGFDQVQVDILKGSYIGELSGLATAFNDFVWTKRLLGTGV